jgi:hypothetical protein
MSHNLTIIVMWFFIGLYIIDINVIHLFVLFEHRYSIEKIWGYATIICATTCDYVLFTTTFITIYQLHQIWGRFATILQLMCNYYLLHPPMWMILRLYSSMNKPPCPISYMCHYVKMHRLQLHIRLSLQSYRTKLHMITWLINPLRHIALDIQLFMCPSCKHTYDYLLQLHNHHTHTLNRYILHNIFV